MPLKATVRLLSTLALSAAVAACGPPATVANNGTLSVGILPRAPTTASLVLTSARLRLEHLSVFGDVAPPHPGGPGNVVILDALSSGQSLSFTNLPAGLYSRIQFVVDDVVISGTWRGTPMTADLARFHGPIVDLYLPSGDELGVGEDVSFTVSVDLSDWFAANLLDGATATSGAITLDAQNNGPTASALLSNIVSSFSLK